MDLDRGALARIDRKLLAGLGQHETFQMVRVPVTAAKWSTWKRYCDVAGMSLGRAVVALIDHELLTVFGESADDHLPVPATVAEERLAARERRVATREHGLDRAEEQLRTWAEGLRRKEDKLGKLEQQIEVDSSRAIRPTLAGQKTGRNQPCPCGSDLKYKRCHGSVSNVAQFVSRTQYR